MHTPASRQPGASYAQRSHRYTKKGFRYARSSGDETLLGQLWPTDCWGMVTEQNYTTLVTVKINDSFWYIVGAIIVYTNNIKIIPSQIVLTD